MMTLALIFLCIAQIIHFSRELVLITLARREEKRDNKRAQALDWRRPRQLNSRQKPKRGLFGMAA